MIKLRSSNHSDTHEGTDDFTVLITERAMDYKTDRVLKGQEQKLKDRYQAQLDYYAKALKQTTGHEVKEKIIYAFSLQEGIAL